MEVRKLQFAARRFKTTLRAGDFDNERIRRGLARALDAFQQRAHFSGERHGALLVIFRSTFPARHCEHALRKIYIAPAERGRFAQSHPGVGEQFNLIRAAAFARLGTDGGNGLVKLFARRHVGRFGFNPTAFDAVGGIAENHAVFEREVKHGAHGVQFMREGLRRDFRAARGQPVLTLARSHIANS